LVCTQNANNASIHCHNAFYKALRKRWYSSFTWTVGTFPKLNYRFRICLQIFVDFLRVFKIKGIHFTPNHNAYQTSVRKVVWLSGWKETQSSKRMKPKPVPLIQISLFPSLAGL